MPRPIGGDIKRCFCLTSVRGLSVAYIGNSLRTVRPRKTKIGTEVAHVTRDSDTICCCCWFQHWSGLDYGSVTPTYLLNRLQSVLNAAVHLLHSAWKQDHVTPPPALAMDATMDRLQARSPHLLLFVWSGTALPNRGTSLCGRS